MKDRFAAIEALVRREAPRALGMHGTRVKAVYVYSDERAAVHIGDQHRHVLILDGKVEGGPSLDLVCRYLHRKGALNAKTLTPSELIELLNAFGELPWGGTISDTQTGPHGEAPSLVHGDRASALTVYSRYQPGCGYGIPGPPGGPATVSIFDRRAPTMPLPPPNAPPAGLSPPFWLRSSLTLPHDPNDAGASWSPVERCDAHGEWEPARFW